MSEKTRVTVTKIQKFCSHDGPGVRTTVFFKGCPLRCRWCHNPETQSNAPEFFYIDSLCIGCGRCAAVCINNVHLFDNGVHTVERARCMGCMKCADACPTGAVESCGRQMSVDEILQEVLRDRVFYGKNGGLTLSGGEPMSQPEAAMSLLRAAKAEGIGTAVETCGYFDGKYLPLIAEFCDIALWDIKDCCDDRHRANTGVSNKRIIANLRELDRLGGRSRMRCIMLRGVNMDDESLRALAELYRSLANCEGVELLPCHGYGASKYSQLGAESDPCSDLIPSDAECSRAARVLRAEGVKIIRR